MSTFVVGDVHGCFDSLQKLLEDCGFRERSDRLWFVGDLVNRGPKSLEVLRWARETQDRLEERMVAVLGNHDLHLVARHAGISGSKRRDTLDTVLGADDADGLVDWLRHRPLLHREGKRIVVHAGLLPSWTPKTAAKAAHNAERRLRDPAELPALLKWPVSEKDDEDPERITIAALTRLRTCTADGQLCPFSGPPNEAPPGCFPWFRVPDRRSRKASIFCGHWAAMGLHREDGVFALDSGAAWGGRLTAVRLEDGRLFQRTVTETGPP